MPAPFSIAVADADQYRIAVAGVALSQGAGQTGYADGEFFNWKPKGPSFVSVEGTDGSVARSKTNRRLCTIKLNLLQTASYNAYLSALLATDENLPNGAGIGSFVLEDLQGTTLLLCTAAWIVQPADITLDRSAKSREWEIEGIRDIVIVGGN